MIRDDEERAELLQEVAERRERAAERLRDHDDPESAMQDVDACREDIRRFLSVIRLYDRVKSGGRAAMVPGWSLTTGATLLSWAMYTLRRFAGLKQDDLAGKLKTKQSSVARSEKCPERDDMLAATRAKSLEEVRRTERAGAKVLRLDRVMRWARACRYEPMVLFVRPSGYNEAGVAARFGVEAVCIRQFFMNGEPQDALQSLLERLRALVQADSASLYMMDDRGQWPTLRHAVGLRHEWRVDSGEVTERQQELDHHERASLYNPMLFAREATTQFVDLDLHRNRAHCTAFTEKEGIKSFLAIPFAYQKFPGVVFLNYRSNKPEPFIQFLRGMDEVASTLQFFLSGWPADAWFRPQTNRARELRRFLRRAFYQIGFPEESTVLTLHLEDAKGDALICDSAFPYIPSEQVTIRLDQECVDPRGITRLAFKERVAIRREVLRDGVVDRSYEPLPHNLRFIGDPKWEMAVPIFPFGVKLDDDPMLRPRPLGVLNAECATLEGFTDDQQRVLETTAEQIAFWLRPQIERALPQSSNPA